MSPVILYVDDMDACERADHDRYGLALTADRIDYDESGNIVPIITAEEWRAFVRAWRWNDPNGTHNPNGITVGDGALMYTDTEGFRCVWSVVGMRADGQPLYRIDNYGIWYR
mgnify:CR=1 FL=1